MGRFKQQFKVLVLALSFMAKVVTVSAWAQEELIVRTAPPALDDFGNRREQGRNTRRVV